MAEFVRVTPDFAVAQQLTEADIARAAAEGFKTLVNNRPDGEATGQMTSLQAEAAAKKAGMAYRVIPFVNPPSLAEVEATETMLADTQAPVLAFCRTGTRSITVWAFAEARSGARSPDEIIEAAAGAGYDLSPHRGTLAKLAGG
jgi:uncharacterized protein (TIGR01244 family)